MNEVDLHIYQKLGLRPRIADLFFARDAVNFYKEKVQKVSEKEEPYFTKSLSLFVEFMESLRPADWERFKWEFWERLLSFSYLDLAYEQSLEQTKLFYQTIRNFAKWLDEQYPNLNFGSRVESLSTELEEEVLQSVRLLDVYQQKIESPFLTGYEEVRRQTLLQEESGHTLSEGVFEAMSLDQDRAIFKSLMNNVLFEVHLPPQAQADLKVGTSLIGVLKEISPNKWEILVLDRVFPPTALPFLKQAIGVS